MNFDLVKRRATFGFVWCHNVTEFFTIRRQLHQCKCELKAKQIQHKVYLQTTWYPRTLGPRVIHSHAFLTELTWQMLIAGYLTSLLFVY